MSTDFSHPQKTQREKLPRFLSFSILALIGLTVLTIVTLFLDSIEGRGPRIALTLVVFAAFVGLTAWDSRKTERLSWYPPSALLSNGVFLGASLLTIWLSPHYFGFGFAILYYTLIYALVLRLGLLFGTFAMGELDRDRAERRELGAHEVQSSKIATSLGGAASILFVAYMAARNIIGRESVSFETAAFWDIYLKLSTATLILAALALSISLLLRWHFRGEQRRLEKVTPRAESSPATAVQPQASAVPVEDRAEANGLEARAVEAQRDVDFRHTEALGEREPSSRGSEAGQVDAPAESESETEELLPWPRFADGEPYPAGSDGQPDFEAAELRARA